MSGALQFVDVQWKTSTIIYTEHESCQPLLGCAMETARVKNVIWYSVTKMGSKGGKVIVGMWDDSSYKMAKEWLELRPIDTV